MKLDTEKYILYQDCSVIDTLIRLDKLKPNPLLLIVEYDKIHSSFIP